MSIHKKLKVLKKANELEAQIKHDLENPPSHFARLKSDGEGYWAERNEYFLRLNNQLKEVQSIQARIKAN